MKLIEDTKLRNLKYIFDNREDAGKLLSKMLNKYAGKNTIVLAIPAGGVPIGKTIAEKLSNKFDLIITRKIQFPDNPEAGFGAVSFDSEIILNQELIKRFSLKKLIVDDGLASGYTMLAAIKSAKKYKPKKLIVAIPTSSANALIGKEVDEVYCLNVRDDFIFAVADAYREWHDLTDEEVLSYLVTTKGQQ